MKKVVIDLAQMLAELQALDLRAASVKELIEYQTKLEFVKAGVDCSDDLPADVRAFAAQCLEYYDEIRSEFKRRGFDFSNL